MLFVIVATLFLNHSTTGRRVFAIGNSVSVSRLSGVRTGFSTAGSGFCSALVGVLLAGFSQQAFYGMGDPFLLSSIAVVVLGGTLITGGRGHYLGILAARCSSPGSPFYYPVQSCRRRFATSSMGWSSWAPSWHCGNETRVSEHGRHRSLERREGSNEQNGQRTSRYPSTRISMRSRCGSARSVAPTCHATYRAAYLAPKGEFRDCWSFSSDTESRPRGASRAIPSIAFPSSSSRSSPLGMRLAFMATPTRIRWR